MSLDNVIGEIDQLGESVRGFQLGDRVADMTVVCQCRLKSPQKFRLKFPHSVAWWV